MQNDRKKEASRRGWGGFFFSRCPGLGAGPKGYVLRSAELLATGRQGRKSRVRRDYFFFEDFFAVDFLAGFLAAAFFAMASYLLSSKQTLRKRSPRRQRFFSVVICIIAMSSWRPRANTAPKAARG
jgi:hypothetical protein